MAVGLEPTRCHVLFDGLRPHPKQPFGAAAVLNEVEVDPLDASGGSLILEGGEVLVELPLSQ